MNTKRRQFWFIGFLACVALLLLAGLVVTFSRSGVHVTIKNTGSQPLRSVVLHVPGASHSLGDIPLGATAQATVHATGESHLEIEFTNPDGQPYRLDAGGYFEPGYRGTIDISIKDGVIEKNEQRIGLPWSLP
jgi:hypothetical protein